MSEMLQSLYDSGAANIIYYLFHAMDFVGALSVNVYLGPKYGLSVKKSVLTTLIVYPLVYLLMMVLYWIEMGFRGFGGQNIVRVYIYIPLVAVLAAKILRVEWKKICDFIAPCVCVTQGIGHIGCLFTGCCQGFPFEYGIYNPALRIKTFPVQICEALTALAIVVLLLMRAKEKKYHADGTAFPLMLMLYGSTRFVWEFFRNNEKLVWGCSSLAFHALFMAVVGGVAYLIINCRKGCNSKRLNRC